MKQIHLVLYSLLLLVLTGCGGELPRTDYTHLLPQNATQVVAVNLESIAQKSGATADPTLRANLWSLLNEQMGKDLSEQTRSYADNPQLAGLNTQAPAYLFKAPKIHAITIAMQLSDLAQWEQCVQALVSDQLLSSPNEADGYRYANLPDAGVQLAYNNGSLLITVTENATELNKLQPAITSLMKQGREQSLADNATFRAMNAQKGDIKLMMTPDGLPFNLRGILNWPHGTQLLGFALFENGRAYAQLQQADFEGDTREGNQPFHPQNASQLQQAMMQMMQGTPFNIELTTEELLTLTNVRVLMEVAPGEPEVNMLYQLLNRIETLNMRGDNHRTRFTLVLKEKNVNALQQLVTFAKTLIGG